MTSACAHVIGAGIAGLAAAAALTRQGWKVHVLERSPDRRTTGGGIGITPNGMRALDALGAGGLVRDRSVVQMEGGVRTPSGRWVARQDLDFVERRFDEPIRALQRIELIRSLEEVLPPGSLRYGAQVEPPTRSDDGRTALRVNGVLQESDLVVGADGIHSATRRSAFPHGGQLRDCGSTSWRAVVPAHGLELVPAETWGSGKRLSILPLPGGEVHFSALVRSPLEDPSIDDPVAQLRSLFRGWHDPVPQLLERAADAIVFRDVIQELERPLNRLWEGRTVLVGDAAHPMTPNVGSANLALEDAVELAHAVSADPSWLSLQAGLARYDNVRRPRTSRLSRTSRWMGRVAELRWPPAVALRNGCVWVGGWLPAAVSGRSMDALVDWTPPNRS